MNWFAKIWSGLRLSGWLVLRNFAAFLRSPSLAAERETAAISRPALFLWLLVLSFAVTAVFALLALPLMIATDAAARETLERVLGGPPLSVILGVVILGPLVEEMIFRGWLTGTLRAVAGTLLFLAIWFGGLSLIAAHWPAIAGPGVNIALAAAALLAFAAVNRSAETNRAGWYDAAFPYLFWAQGLVFGGLHFANIASSSMMLPVLMALPLVLCGWIWGYARIRLGFAAAWLLHMAYNVPVAAAIMAGLSPL